MRILALDPGYDRLGVAVVERQSAVDSLLFSTCIETSRADTLIDRLFVLGQAYENLLNTYQPQAVAIETLFFNQNQKTALGVAAARGMLIYLARARACHVFEFGPQEIKVAVTGYGKSDKTAVTAMVRRLIKNVPENARDDEYDAIAVGLTALAHYRAP